jgi:hypothetical protein
MVKSLSKSSSFFPLVEQSMPAPDQHNDRCFMSLNAEEFLTGPASSRARSSGVTASGIAMQRSIESVGFISLAILPVRTNEQAVGTV